MLESSVWLASVTSPETSQCPQRHKSPVRRVRRKVDVQKVSNRANEKDVPPLNQNTLDAKAT